MSKVFRSVLLTASLAAWCGTAFTADAPTQPVNINIDETALYKALLQFSQQAGLNLVFQEPEKVSDLRVTPLSGTYTPQAALEKLLKDSGYTYEFIGPQAVAVRAISSETDRAKPIAGAAESEAAKIRVAQAGAGGSTDAGTSAEAQGTSDTDDGKLEEIVVTAQKREESIQDAALSISVLTGETIERRSLVSLDDFIKYVPGVSLHDRGPGLNSITIRGIGGDVSSGNTDPTTGIYLGEIPLAALGLFSSQDIKLVDIERIEVLRGPQGTLFGAGSMGGTLRYVPNGPDLENFGGNLNAGYSHTDRNGGNNEEVAGVVNIPLLQDKLALRVAGYFFDNSGYIDYVGDPARAAFVTANGASFSQGDNGGASEYAGGRASLLWKPVEMVSATFTYVNQQLDQDGFGEENLSLGGYLDSPLSFGDRTPDGRELRYSDLELFNLTLEWELDQFDIVSSTSRFDSRAGERRDATRGGFPFAVGVIDDVVSRATTQELRVSSKFAGRFNFLAGAYYEDNEYTRDTSLAWLGASELCCGGWGTDPDDLLDSRVGDSVEQKALFSELYYEFTEQFQLTLGGRYFDYDRSTFAVDTGFVSGADNRQSGSTNGTTLKANLGYSPNRDSLLYVQWAQGFRLGKPLTPPPAVACDIDGDGILDGTTSAPINADRLEPDTVDTWELGGKFTLLDSRWTVNTAVYHTRWEKLPATVFGTCGVPATFNAAEARSQGLEVESTIALTRSLLLNLGASIVDAELTQNATVLKASEGDPLANVVGFQGSVGLQYQFNISGHSTFTRADYAYVDGYHADFAELTPELGNYGKLDMRAGIALGKYQVSLYGTNITNENALTSADAFGRAWRLRPRTYGMDIRYSF